MMKSQSSLDLFCLRLGLPTEAANSLGLGGPIPFRSLQLSDSLPLPKCSRLLDLERDIDEPCKQSKPDEDRFNKVGFLRFEEKRIHIRPPPITSIVNHCSFPHMLILRSSMWYLSIWPLSSSHQGHLVIYTVNSFPFIIRMHNRILRAPSIKTCSDKVWSSGYGESSLFWGTTKQIFQPV